MAVSQEGKEDENAKIGVGIVGTGAQANIHAMGVIGNPNAEIVGLCDNREGVAEEFATRYGLDVPVFKDYRELLKMEGLDAVCVVTSNEVHAEISIAAVEAGKHVLCEKPMVTAIEDARAMVAAAKKAGVTNMIGYTKRFFKGTRYLYDFLRREDLGRVYNVRAFYFQSWLSNPNTPAPWRLEKSRTGTGALGDLAAHVTDLVQHLVGDEITRVTGMMKTFVDERPSLTDPGKKQKVDVDDGIMFGAEFKNGALGVIQASRNATGHPDHWRVEIDMEKGSVIYDSTDGRVRLATMEGPARRAGWLDLPIPAYRYGTADNPNQKELDHFIECIRSGETPSPTFEVGLKTERVLDAVERSHNTGRQVEIEG